MRSPPIDLAAQLRYTAATSHGGYRAMVEWGPSGGMVDAMDSKSIAARRVGSSPTSGTNSLSFCRPLLAAQIWAGNSIGEFPLTVAQSWQNCGGKAVAWSHVMTG